jgi:hypothetical protein
MSNTGPRIRVLGAEPFIYAPPTSRGRADERAFHLVLDALNGAGADAALACDLAHAHAGSLAIFAAIRRA